MGDSLEAVRGPHGCPGRFVHGGCEANRGCDHPWSHEDRAGTSPLRDGDAFRLVVRAGSPSSGDPAPGSRMCGSRLPGLGICALRVAAAGWVGWPRGARGAEEPAGDDRRGFAALAAAAGAVLSLSGPARRSRSWLSPRSRPHVVLRAASWRRPWPRSGLLLLAILRPRGRPPGRALALGGAAAALAGARRRGLGRRPRARSSNAAPRSLRSRAWCTTFSRTRWLQSAVQLGQGRPTPFSHDGRRSRAKLRALVQRAALSSGDGDRGDARRAPFVRCAVGAGGARRPAHRISSRASRSRLHV
jgi:hypothetical protein